MFIDIANESLGEWFNFFTSTVDPNTGDVVYGDPVSDARVRLRSLTPFFEERLSKRKRETEHVLNPKTRQMERISFLPELSVQEAMKERDDSWDYAITGLEGFKDSATKEVLECDRETKLKLMKNPVFDRFIAKCLQRLAESGATEKEEEEKNLLPG